MKKYFGIVCIIAALLLSACGGSGSSERRDRHFAGSFTDEFGNKFVLNEDYTATIQFAGTEEVVETSWRDGENHDSPFATIKYNGDPAYYYLRDACLYRRYEDMQNGKLAITVNYDE